MDTDEESRIDLSQINKNTREGKYLAFNIMNEVYSVAIRYITDIIIMHHLEGKTHEGDPLCAR